MPVQCDRVIIFLKKQTPQTQDWLDNHIMIFLRLLFSIEYLTQNVNLMNLYPYDPFCCCLIHRKDEIKGKREWMMLGLVPHQKLMVGSITYKVEQLSPSRVSWVNLGMNKHDHLLCWIGYKKLPVSFFIRPNLT